MQVGELNELVETYEVAVKYEGAVVDFHLS